jgi:RNA-binding protein NOB1
VEADGEVAEEVASNEVDESPEDEITERGPLEAEYAEAPAEQSSNLASSSSSPSAQKNDTPKATVVFEDPSDSDDGEGEWITPGNVALHKSRALDLLPSTSTSDSFTTVTKKGRRSRKSQNAVPDDAPAVQMDVGCMTADFAMQNVLLQMGLNLVSVEGKRIQRVKTWVLRCHACFK